MLSTNAFNYCVFFLDWYLFVMQCLSLSLFEFFVSKLSFSDTSIVILVFIFTCMEYLSIPSLLIQFTSLDLRWVSWATYVYIGIVCVSIQLLYVCWLEYLIHLHVKKLLLDIHLLLFCSLLGGGYFIILCLLSFLLFPSDLLTTFSEMFEFFHFFIYVIP